MAAKYKITPLSLEPKVRDLLEKLADTDGIPRTMWIRRKILDESVKVGLITEDDIGDILAR